MRVSFMLRWEWCQLIPFDKKAMYFLIYAICIKNSVETTPIAKTYMNFDTCKWKRLIKDKEIDKH